MNLNTLNTLNALSNIEDIINNNNKIKDEIFSVFENNELLEYSSLDEEIYQDCSLLTKPIILPYVAGLLFFRNYNILQNVNVIIPDLFRICFSIPPIIFEKNNNSTLICPKIGFLGINNNFSSSKTRIQLLLPENIIKSFLYFGYSTDLDENISFKFLSKKIETLIKSNNNNPEKFYDLNYLFDLIYSDDTILKQLINFGETLKYIRNPEVDGTNFCNFNIKWLFSYYCYSRKVNVFTFYNNFDNNNKFSYSDLSVLNYLTDEGNQSLSVQRLLLFLESVNANNPQFEQNLKQLQKEILVIVRNNIFRVITYANEVKQYIYSIMQNILYNKIYKEQVFSSEQFYNITEKIYSNYKKNKLFINKNYL